MDPLTLKKINKFEKERTAFVVVTDMRSGRDRILTHNEVNIAAGNLGEALRKAISSGKSSLLDIDGHHIFINVHIPKLRIVVIGAVQISQALAPIAKAAGYEIEIIDPRMAFATSQRFPNVKLYTQWPDEILNSKPLDKLTALVAVTHDPKIDDAPLIAALKSECMYIGALGSRKTHEKRILRLKAAGLDHQQINRIHSPVGLDIKASNPGEIAVAIMAEIIQQRYHLGRVAV